MLNYTKKQKRYADKRRKEAPKFSPGDKVWVTLHPVSKGQQKKTSKFMPKRDGPYVIVSQRSPTTFDIAEPNDINKILGKYHVSAIKPYQERQKFQSSSLVTPVAPLRKRGRPRKVPLQQTLDVPSPASLPGRQLRQRGRL